MSDYNYGSSALDFSSPPSLGGGSGHGQSGQPSSAQMMEAVKQQIAVANAQELLTVSFNFIYSFTVFNLQKFNRNHTCLNMLYITFISLTLHVVLHSEKSPEYTEEVCYNG